MTPRRPSGRRARAPRASLLALVASFLLPVARPAVAHAQDAPTEAVPPRSLQLTGLTKRQLADESDRWHFQGYRRTRVTRVSRDGQDLHDATWQAIDTVPSRDMAAVDAAVARFMERHRVPGFSFAIAHDGRLVLAKAYGHADPERSEPLAPRHRFRIASVSKPLTAVAILRLQERHYLRLHDKVFGPTALLGSPRFPAHPQPDPRLITIDHLLTHAAGGWAQDLGFDPMFHNPAWTRADLVEKTLLTQPLQREPGAEFHYSNFGFCLLGRVIEAASGRPYDAFVQSEVLQPCGIRAMEVGGDTAADRRPDEVRYQGQDGEDPYGMKVARMDAHGGWIANAVDVVRFLVHVDQRPSKPDLLRPDSLSVLFAPGPASPRYSRGWAVNNAPNHWHDGSLPGSQSIAVITHDGFCWAALCNTRARGIGPDLDQLMWDVRNALTRLPAIDLFP